MTKFSAWSIRSVGSILIMIFLCSATAFRPIRNYASAMHAQSLISIDSLSRQLTNHHPCDKMMDMKSYQGTRLYGNIAEFGGEEEEDDNSNSSTDEELQKTHGYEGDFKVGDVVRVAKPIRIWSVKQHAKEGFMAEGFVGTVSQLVLYGRKHKTLCSAITPIKVEFLPDGEGIPAGMFEKKFVAHFAADELDLIQAAAEN